jgi:hypothetical protein
VDNGVDSIGYSNTNFGSLDAMMVYALVGIPLLWIAAVYVTILDQRLRALEKDWK